MLQVYQLKRLKTWQAIIKILDRRSFLFWRFIRWQCQCPRFFSLGSCAAGIRALRDLPPECRPKVVHGCEGWRGLDWLDDGIKVIQDVSGHDYFLDASHRLLGFDNLQYDAYNGEARVIADSTTSINLISDSLKENKLTVKKTVSKHSLDTNYTNCTWVASQEMLGLTSSARRSLFVQAKHPSHIRHTPRLNTKNGGNTTV